MATRRWLGHAAGVKQVSTLTIANTWAQNDTVTLTIDGIDVVITIGTLTTTAQVATTVKEAFNGESLTDTSASYTPNSGIQTIGQFTELTASVSGSVVTFTANAASKVITMSASETTAGSGTATLSGTVSASGKYILDAADNWSGNTVPVDGDTEVFEFGSVGPEQNLDEVAINPAAVYIMQAFTGKMGLAEQNIDNASYPYADYRVRSRLYNTNAVTCPFYIGQGEGQGSSRIRINADDMAAKFHVYGSGQRELAGVPPILLAGTNSSNELNNYNGDVGVAFYASESAVLSKLRNGSGEASQAKTYCGPGVTLSSCTVEMASGELTTNSAISAVNMTGGEAAHRTGGTVTTLRVWGGHWSHDCGATVTTLTVGPSGVFDKSKNMEAMTITNAVQMYKGAKLLDPHGTITFSAGIVLNGCTIDEVEIDVGFGRTVSIS